MKKITKIISLLLVCLTVLNMGVFAAEYTAEETVTTAESEITTTLPEVITTAEAEEETTTQTVDESTTKAEEESTTKAEEESTTAPETSTTTPETTTTTPSTTTPDISQPESSEPEVTEPDVTEPTQPSEPEIVLPEAPSYLSGHYWYDSKLLFTWSNVEGADGFALYQKVGDEWVFIAEKKSSSLDIGGFLYNSIYEFAIKSYIEVDGVKYYSENQAECTVETSDTIGQNDFKLESVKEGIKLTISPYGGISGYRIYVYKDNKNVKLASIPVDGENEIVYIYKDVKIGEEYELGIKPYSKGTKGTVFGSLIYNEITYKDFTKAEITSKSATSSSVTLKWTAVEGASGYRVYVKKDGKWTYESGIKAQEHTVKNLKDVTKYQFKIRAYFKADGKTTWGTYSDVVSVTTKGKTVKASRISKLKKYFTDGDWSVKITDLDDGVYGKLDYTLAVKGQKIFVRYDYKNNKNMRDFEYLIDFDTETVNVIFDDNKTYVVLKGEDAELAAYSIVMMGLILDMSSAKGVTAKTTTYSGKAAVAEIYTDKDLEAKKTYYFVNDKVKALKVTYSDGSSETFKISKINDTPSASVFKIPKGYKRASY